ncbi:MAG: glycosyltransferase family 4 protein [Chloracidobacterium sp.]|nr:glycosyltransferase family 4 protein [Chloracidobacterium sp.]
MKRVSLCVVGNLLGRNPGYITTQGQILADLLTKEGHTVISCSSKINRVFRLLDIVWTVFRNRKKFDVLILEVYSGLNILMSETVSLLGRLLGVPMIFVLHGGNLPEFSKKYPRWVKRVLERGDILVAPSTYLVKGLKHLGLSIRVVRNIIDVNEYPHRLRRNISPKMIWMRSFHTIYNPQMAVMVVRSVRDKHPDASLVMAGLDKGLEFETRSLVEELGLQHAVRFPGFLDHEAKIKEFSKADIYLNTNRIDNMPVAVVEACAMGLPVVATAVGGLPDLLVHGKTGMLVADDDVEEMTNAVSSLLKDPELTEKLSKNGRALAELSSWNTVRGCWVELFTEIMKTKLQGQRSKDLSYLTSNK